LSDDQPHQGCLARSIPSQQTDALFGFDSTLDFIEQRWAVEGNRQIV
jgi:hypothetical protein